ncbi:MAG: hypothetical protein A2172_02105 [Candidatus Woykebacteria bacterium RBG_13_40_15]|uniref:KOW domain-containing protein n=1 Tax=Candidatus Woykebacteria bacterium RBG_13_40_15 TaxID=1802593 RepID=A0A1G1W6E3_9BACT|nr:MAG: hypothetical protein A2172_02105 [Candidatus Woykebacteria bacterium RBG_13_40_15]
MLLPRNYPGFCKPAVKIGQPVSEADVIAHCEISSGQRLVKIAHALGVGSRDVKKYLTRKIGDSIYQGEIIAKRRLNFGLTKKEIKSPVDGVITEIDKRGDLIVKFLPRPIRLVAAGSGVVEKIEENQIFLSVVATKINGFISVGGEHEGLISIIANPQDFVLPVAIKADYKDKIIVGGALFERSALEKAVALGVKGIITGGMNQKDFSALNTDEDVGLAVLVTEGFGKSPMGRDIWDFLKSKDGRPAFILGKEKSIIIPEASGTIVTDDKKGHRSWKNLEIGDRVTFFREESSDLVGTVKELPGEQILNSGILAEVALVEFSSGEKLILPAANLEIVE